MRTRSISAGLGVLLLAGGCATQDQLRQTEVQQGQVVQALRADAGRSESSIADLRAELRRTQDTVHALEVTLTETRTRADAAKAQADTALATSREFLGSLLAAREEQRRQLDANGVAFADLRRKAGDLELKLQSQQRLLEQGNAAFNDAVRRLAAVEAGLQEAGRRSGSLEARAKTGQESDEAFNKQLAALRKQVEDTRSVMNSEGLLQMMRGLEDVRRNSASMRGSIDELQKAQADAAAQSRNYYLDLDTRMRLLKQQSAAQAAPQHAIQQEPAPAVSSSQEQVSTPTPAAGQPVSQ